MFGKPGNSSPLAKVTIGAAIALLVLYTLLAMNLTRIELRCGAACQRIVSGREY